ncbi:MAG: hypothetical protein ABSC19_20355 [Syntrophorhabdales bacterium]
MINGANKKGTSRKQKIVKELIEYGVNVVYLACFFGLFAWYRRLILAEYEITYLAYGTSLVKALVLAKVIMVGDVMGLGRRFAHKSLIVPTLYQSVVFGILVVVFNLLEETVRALLHGRGLAGGFDEIASRGGYEFLARALVVFFAFIPFFAFRELKRVLGEGKLFDLFFRKSP